MNCGRRLIRYSLRAQNSLILSKFSPFFTQNLSWQFIGLNECYPNGCFDEEQINYSHETHDKQEIFQTQEMPTYEPYLIEYNQDTQTFTYNDPWENTDVAYSAHNGLDEIVLHVEHNEPHSSNLSNSIENNHSSNSNSNNDINATNLPENEFNHNQSVMEDQFENDEQVSFKSMKFGKTSSSTSFYSVGRIMLVYDLLRSWWWLTNHKIFFQDEY